MSTPAYLIAQQVIPLVKTQCPRIMIPSGKNSFTFFPGSVVERTVQFRRMMAHADPFWESEDHVGSRRWKTRINVSWLTSAYQNVLFDEIHTVMDLPVGRGRTWDQLKGVDARDIVRRAMQIAKMRIWGIPINLRSEYWFFHRILTGCARKVLPETVWKMACINAGNVYGVNENVVMDALLEQKAYQSLYAIHPLLGRSWVPWIRRFVEQSIDDQPDHSRYAGQLSSALGARGINKSGVKTLHRMAETSPMAFRDAMRILAGSAHVEDAEASSVELVNLLNLLNGNKPAPGVTFHNMMQTVGSSAVTRNPEDLRVLLRIHRWLAKDMRFDPGLVFDWMNFLARERRGSLYRGYRDVTKNCRLQGCRLQGIKSSVKHKEAILAWADRSQRHWHRHRPREERVFQESPPRNYSWKPILDHPVSIEGGWQFVELTSSEALREEGDAMSHCVAGYDGYCHYGRSRIFSVRNDRGQRVSTLELCRSNLRKRKRKQYAINQNRGVRNAAVSSACQRAADQFLRMVNDFVVTERKNP